ncbi:MAG TPA: lipopolysaccharide biosynthesis protein [Caulobacteraceae bacterium]|jgi:O-antigen/teichoic acid export membrane protein
MEAVVGRGGATAVSGLGSTLAVGFAAHFLIALINVVLVPVFLRLLGAQAYGLVTFYIVLQSWMMLFDLGVSPALARQLSRHRAGALGSADAASLLAAAEVVFLFGGLAAGGAIIFGSPWIASHWLGASSLPPRELDLSLRLIGALLVFRWLTGLYQSALVGLERQIRVNAVALAAAVARYGGALAALVWFSASPVVFFAVQAGVTLVEAGLCRVMLRTAMPSERGRWRSGWRSLRKEFRFALGLTAASAATTLIGQADKLTLSHVLPLGEFGLFGLVVSVVGGITMVVPPFVQAFQPRLTTLLAQGRRAEFVHVYRLSAALILALAAGLAGTIAAHPDWVLFAWTGRASLAAHLAPTLSFYAAGAAIASFLFVPFLLQYAQGQVRLHVIGNVSFAAVWIPAEVWAAVTHGALGAGMVWLAGNLLYLLLWVPVIHARLLSPEERRRLDLGVWVRGLLLTLALAASRLLPFGTLTRPQAFAALAAVSLVVTVLGLALSTEMRAYGRNAVAHMLRRRG